MKCAGCGRHIQASSVGYRLTSRNELPTYHSFDAVSQATEDEVYEGAQVYKDPAQIAQFVFGTSTDPYAEGWSFENADRILIIHGDIQQRTSASYPIVKPGDVSSVEALYKEDGRDVLRELAHRDGFHEISGGTNAELIRYGEPWPELPDVEPVANDLDVYRMEDGTVTMDLVEWTQKRRKEIEEAFERAGGGISWSWERPDFMKSSSMYRQGIGIGWSPPEMLYHGTSTEHLPPIEEKGIEPPSYWGTRRIADYYAETAARQSGGEPVVLSVPHRALERCLEPDVRSVEEPLTYTLGKSEEEVWEEWDWDRDDHTYEDSLRAVESAKCSSWVNPRDIEKIRKLG